MDLLIQLVKTSFKIKYNGSVLGVVWVILKPFMQFLILYTVFSQFGGNSALDNFTIYLLTGLVIFSFFQESMMSGAHALLDKAHIILKVNFNKTLAIYATFILALINLVINSIIISIFIIFNPIHTNLLAIMYMLFVLTSLATGLVGISFFTSIVSVKFRDMQHIIEVAMQLMFYATPIFYQLEIVPDKFRSILQLNPLYIFIEAIREALIYGEIIYVKRVVFLTIISVFVFLLGRLFFKNKVVQIAEYF